LNLKISLTLILTITISLALGFVDNQVFAEETIGFAMAEDISAHLTFKFRDGIEQQEFAVFKTTDFVNGKWITNRVYCFSII
jgi:hypothetical protein